MNDRVTYLDRICCCDATLFRFLKYENFRDSVTSAGFDKYCIWATVWIKDHFLISREQLEKQKRKRMTDQATVNTMVNTLMLHRKKKEKKKK